MATTPHERLDKAAVSTMRIQRNSQRGWRFGAGLLACALALSPALSQAAPVNYGDFGPDYPPGVLMYLDVTESSGTDPIPPGRYGPPDINGDALDFDPTEFVAFSGGGAPDITDVQLNFTLMSLPLTGVTGIEIVEEGDYTLAGTGTAPTQVLAGAIVSVDIFEVDGIALAIPLSASVSASFSDDLSGGQEVVSPWGFSLVIDFASILNEAEITYEWGVSKAEFVIDNQLIALSEPNSVAFIAKKDFTITPSVIIDPDFVIPEPGSIWLMMLGLAGFAVVLRRHWRHVRR